MSDQQQPDQPQELPAVKTSQPKLVSKPQTNNYHRQIYNQISRRLWMLGGRFRTFTGYAIFTDGANHTDRQRMRLVVGDQLEAALQKDHQQSKTPSQQRKQEKKQKGKQQ